MNTEIRETILDALYTQKLNLKDLIQKLDGAKDETLIKAISSYRADVAKIEASIRWIHEQRVQK